MNSSFHVIIHAIPPNTMATHSVELDGITSPCFESDLPRARFGTSFEEVDQRMQQLPRMFLEPDGAFVWVIESGQNRHQLDGLLVDDGECLLHVELKGSANDSIMNELLGTLGWPDQHVAFQLVAHGIQLPETEFRKRFLSS